MREVDADLAAHAPMQRLLQGDVGLGKTVVALYALCASRHEPAARGADGPDGDARRAAFLTIEGLCAELGVRPRARRARCGRRRRGRARGARERRGAAAVGTHALIQEQVEFADLAVAVVDEQHRFGVEQRAALVEGRAPHVLHMTATPIPRTLALTVYGDLRVSEIARPPANRRPIVTGWIPRGAGLRGVHACGALLEEGRQAYVVCPLIEESETSRAQAAEQEAERLQGGELRGFRVGCLHGRLSRPTGASSCARSRHASSTSSSPRR